MTVETFLVLFTTLSVVTSLVTEGVKKLLDSLEFEYVSNILVLCIAAIVGGAGTAIFYISNDIAWTSLNVICLFLMMCANWLGATLGYDKVMQTIKQIGGK